MKVLDALTRTEAEAALRQARRRHPALGWSIERDPAAGGDVHHLLVADEDARGMEDELAREAQRLRPARLGVVDGERAAVRVLERLAAVADDDGGIRELEGILTYQLGTPLRLPFDGFLVREVVRLTGGVRVRGACWIFTSGATEVEEPFEAELATDGQGSLSRFELRCGRPSSVVAAKLAAADDDALVHGYRIRVRLDDGAPWAYELRKENSGS
jgi:hypothetical protein